MDSTIFFTPILNEIRSLKKDLTLLLDRVPENQEIKRYTPKDIAENTPLSIQTVWAMIKDGRIKAERIGRKYLITQLEFDRACQEVKSLKYKR
ncbi:helix-turn-helix domain-containing protein [Robiginitalea sp. IMCC43444]|uniref:helix-turn-helix domain-containing protein n=1 Tax=Robiginitalea sp. IMCC43444 TaxID=3459121 RepID=UPI004041F872